MTASIRNLVMATLLLSIVAIEPQTSSAQQLARDEQRDTYELQVVRNALRDPAMALGASFTEKQINRLGDKLAIALIKIYSEQELVEPSNVRRYLPLIRAAFVAPRIVSDPADRKPAITMMLLRQLEAHASNDACRRQIRGVLRFVQAQTVSQ